jgi:hypothetical protein
MFHVSSSTNDIKTTNITGQFKIYRYELSRTLCQILKIHCDFVIQEIIGYPEEIANYRLAYQWSRINRYSNKGTGSELLTVGLVIGFSNNGKGKSSGESKIADDGL